MKHFNAIEKTWNESQKEDMKLIVLEEHESENVGECILKKSLGLVDDQASKAGTELITFYPNILKNSFATIAIWVEAVRPVVMRNISFNKVIL